jgi:POT family proton-dependent oligopeptide transporter
LSHGDAFSRTSELRRAGPTVLGHPRGLVVLAGTELWERISFHGMQALLVLYMVGQLLLPGHIEHIAGFAAFRRALTSLTGPLSVQALATQIFGLYVGLVYFTPLLGGMLGDRWLGRRRTVVLGGLLMTAGHFCMAFEQPFLLALLLLIVGTGCLRGNLISQVGSLYSPDDQRRATAFQIYYTMLNMGAFVAPLITGTLAQEYGWHYGFTFAGFGMLVGIVIYVTGQRDLPLERRASANAPRAALAPGERRIVAVLWLMLPLIALFWIAQSQVWNTYNLWARDHVDLAVGPWRIPIPWLQAFDSLAVIVMVPPVLGLWRWQARRSREPDDFVKLGIGCLIFAAGMAWLAAADLVAEGSGKVPLPWALAFHLISNTGYLYFAPLAIALFARAAPAAVNSMMVGVYYLAMFAGSTISGRIGGLYERVPATQFWLLHGAIVAAGGVLFLLLAAPLRRELTPASAT